MAYFFFYAIMQLLQQFIRWKQLFIYFCWSICNIQVYMTTSIEVKLDKSKDHSNENKQI